MIVEPGILLADTITKLPPDAAGMVVVSGSHGGIYPGYLAAKARVRAAIFNDAGVGRDEAGIGSLLYLEKLGVAAAVISHRSCAIGDTQGMFAQGRVSRANALAIDLGVHDGIPCAYAARKLRAASASDMTVPSIGETRGEIAVSSALRKIFLLDSASLVRPEDAGQIVVTGSHGGLIGGDPAMALRTDAYAAVFSDAGRPDGPGVTRLPALAARGIAALTVSAQSARIGDAKSIFHDGMISAVNNIAAARGAAKGRLARDCLEVMAR